MRGSKNARVSAASRFPPPSPLTRESATCVAPADAAGVAARSTPGFETPESAAVAEPEGVFGFSISSAIRSASRSAG